MEQDKLAHLKRQLQQLEEGTHSEWLRKVTFPQQRFLFLLFLFLTERLQVKKLDQQYKERMRINAVVKELELEMAEQDYQNEKRNAAKEFEEKKVNIHNQFHS